MPCYPWISSIFLTHQQDFCIPKPVGATFLWGRTMAWNVEVLIIWWHHKTIAKVSQLPVRLIAFSWQAYMEVTLWKQPNCCRVGKYSNEFILNSLSEWVSATSCEEPLTHPPPLTRYPGCRNLRTKKNKEEAVHSFWANKKQAWSCHPSGFTLSFFFSISFHLALFFLMSFISCQLMRTYSDEYRWADGTNMCLCMCVHELLLQDLQPSVCVPVWHSCIPLGGGILTTSTTATSENGI